ncbi:hypothetical protein [Pseudomonas capsici]|uniref:Uncharacterized protein n=1 Tax=Pseudomonas capsici TaxID=2810614 RepID=A0ABT3BX14_9PSED|nr:MULTISPECIES: hypothetical protein [Pseudomonas]MCV4267801.1 hypothetical protein [Pseudomonas capsici]MCV4278618.1 hypothetical protein [Pseudomonas capsici]MCV4331850.1 hypothetical protein [Pseudomonas capsici]MCV4377370.1 hypothetical protein [Pseudomonas capsici]GFM56078.1 hypothetical protein PSCICF_22560 [Pseudomonas cichorii]
MPATTVALPMKMHCLYERRGQARSYFNRSYLSRSEFIREDGTPDNTHPLNVPAYRE